MQLPQAAEPQEEAPSQEPCPLRSHGILLQSTIAVLWVLQNDPGKGGLGGEGLWQQQGSTFLFHLRWQNGIGLPLPEILLLLILPRRCAVWGSPDFQLTVFNIYMKLGKTIHLFAVRCHKNPSYLSFFSKSRYTHSSFISHFSWRF